ncbi:MAG TPA: hypothetical protein VIY56_02745, partial [Vicinamibacterales bacterium]
MPPRFELVAPDRLQIREGGGCLSLFGLPFFGAGVFLLLVSVGLVPMQDTEDLPTWGPLVIGLMGVAFTAVGGGLTLGRSWITLDVTQRTVLSSKGLLVPMTQHAQPLDDYAAVTLGFVGEDSDSHERFPVGLQARAGAHLPLATFTDYAEARGCAAAAARHLRLDIEDGSTDHTVRLRAELIDRSLSDRLASQPDPPVPSPSDPRAAVHHEADGVRIVIPNQPVSRVALAFSAMPLAIALWVGPGLLDFFRRTHTPMAMGWVFIGFMTICFGVSPIIAAVNGLLRARRGRTIVHITRRGVRIEEQGAWKLRTLATLEAADILDVDFSTRESTVASAKMATVHKLAATGQPHPGTMSPRMVRLIAAAARWAKGRGVVVKTRHGLTAFGHELDDAEIHYLHWVVRRAL